MDLRNVRRVGIVGAGVAGLAAAKTLIADGYDCTVFDRADRLGGVWQDGYVGFGVQVQKELYQFPDWPLPEATPDFTPGPTFQKYLEAYADRFGVTPHLRLGTPVQQLTRRDDGRPGWAITVAGPAGAQRENFDLVVVATGLYSDTPNLPDISGRDGFKGEVLHVSQLKTRAPLENRRVAVIGYGKSATDAVLEAASVAKDAHLVFRDVHWPVPRRLAGLLPFKWGMLNRLTGAMITPYVHPSPVARWLHRIGRPLPWIFWRAVELLLRVQWGLDAKIENGRNLVPTVPVEIDCFGESTMVPRPDFYRQIRRGRIHAHRSDVARFTQNGIVLGDGNALDVDCVLFCTGWRSGFEFLSPEIRRTLGDDEDGFYLYRHMLHPDLPNLVFAGRASSFLSVATFCLQARWLAELMAGHVALPDRETMLAEIDALKAWKRGWMPFSTARGARLLLHMLYYHDELLQDFGANPLRKRGILAPLKELFAPYQPSDYRAIASGEWVNEEARSAVANGQRHA